MTLRHMLGRARPSAGRGRRRAIVGQDNGKRYPIQCLVLTSISSTGHPGKERALITHLTDKTSLQLLPGPVSGSPRSSTIGSDGWLLNISGACFRLVLLQTGQQWGHFVRR